MTKDQDQINFQDFACLLVEAFVNKTRPTEQDKKEYLRDLFAGMAFQSRIAKYNDWTLDSLAEQAYKDADALLKARKQ